MDISCTVSVALLDGDVLQIISDSSREEQENDQFRKTICEHTQHFREKQTINVKHAISVRETCDSYVITYIMATRCADGFLAIVNGPDH